MNKAYQAPEMITEDQLRAVREKSRSAWSTILLPMVPVVALIVGGVIYWLATRGTPYPACVSSSPLQSSSKAKPYLESDHFIGSGPRAQRSLSKRPSSIYEVER